MRYLIYFYDNPTTHVIEVVQGDSARVLEFEAADYEIPEGAEATYYIERPSNAPVYNAATIDGNVITVPLTAEAISEAGDNLLQVRITKDGLYLTSFSAVLLVRRFGGLDAVEAKGQVNLFDQMIADLREELSEVIDTTLSVPNMAADAEVVGQALEPLASKDYVAEYVEEHGASVSFTVEGTKLIFE